MSYAQYRRLIKNNWSNKESSEPQEAEESEEVLPEED